jgi:hypothetical protein
LEPKGQLALWYPGTRSSGWQRAVVAKLYEGLLFACVLAFVLITIAGLFG